MKTNTKRILSMILAMVMLLALVAGCGTTPTDTGAATATPAASSTAASESPAASSAEASTEAPLDTKTMALPLTTEPVTLKIFKPVNRVEQDFKDNAVWAEISKRTGIPFEWECPTTEASGDRLTMILASKQYPEGIDDGVLIDLLELVKKEAPVYWSYLSANPSALRDGTTDKGYLPAIYQLAQKDNNIDTGLWCNVVRADWLKDLNMAVPQTIDEWYTVLKAFKEEKGATFPLPWMLGNNPIWAQAYGIGMMPFSLTGPASVNQFYPDENNKIHFGGIEQGFQDYLMTLSKWYKEGLFDRDFTTRGVFDLPTAAKLIGTGQSGVTGGFLGWTGMYMGANAGADADFELAPCPDPVLEKGQKATVIRNKSEFLGNDGMSITSACKTPEVFIKLINYLSTDEGISLVTYGIEGDTFTMVDGKPKFTDKILKDPMGAYDTREIRISAILPIDTIPMMDVLSQLQPAKTLEDAKIPSDSVKNVYMYYSLNDEESTEFSEIMGDINTYVAENYTKSVMDPAVASKWIEVQGEKLKEMGIERAIEICQGAWDRYLAK